MEGEEGVLALGKEFVGIFKDRPSPHMEGRAEEAFVNLGTGQTSGAQWQLISEPLRAWATEQHLQPSELGVRVTLLVTPPVTTESMPDRDFAVPLR